MPYSPTSLLPPRALAAARAAVFRSLPQMAEVVRGVESTGRPGGPGGAPTTVALLPCRKVVGTGAGGEVTYANRLQGRKGWTFILPCWLPWLPDTVYGTAMVVIPAGRLGRVAYYPTTPGTSGSSEPAWPDTVGATVADGGVTWKGAPLTREVDVRVSDRLRVDGVLYDILDVIGGTPWDTALQVVAIERT